jgi:hypothetical protein
MKFTPSKPTSATITKIHDLLLSIYEGGIALTCEDWSIMLMLNALDRSEYDWVRKSLITQFVNKRTSPSKKDINEVINSAGY